VNFRAICFDATGTLIETSENVGDVYRRVALAHGIDLPAWRLENAFRRILASAPARGTDGDCVGKRRRGEVDWWFERVRETFQATDSTTRFDDFPAFAQALFDHYRSADAWRLCPGASGMLHELQRRQVPMAIASNFDHRLLEILEVLEIERFFQFVAIPSEIGHAKPDSEVFVALAADLNTPPMDILYIGDDSKETLQAIEALGLQVLDMGDVEDLETLPDRLLPAATLANND
jgi:putative hydrolase of the HAD superfamily